VIGQSTPPQKSEVASLTKKWGGSCICASRIAEMTARNHGGTKVPIAQLTISDELIKKNLPAVVSGLNATRSGDLSKPLPSHRFQPLSQFFEVSRIHAEDHRLTMTAVNSENVIFMEDNLITLMQPM